MRAYAKINVGLWVRHRREDGYHEIETIFLPLELHDAIQIEKAKQYHVKGPHYGENDLMYKAYRAMEDRYGPMPISIEIAKRIPAGAGLAGGTADGAAVMRGMRDLYLPAVEDDTLREIARPLGADFPYCIASRPALATGIGDELTFLVPVPSYPLLLLNPGYPVSTPVAYQRLSADRRAGSVEESIACLVNGDIEGLGRYAVNHLKPGVAAFCPEVESMIADLYATGAAFADMTGSGPTVYGIFADERARDRSYAILKARYAAVIRTRVRGERDV
ncbi:4-diphosphocytidyl-2-C-methyl-D-erythritol kinase [Peptoniphilus ivorii]|uniref:4-(cytidine 5'-diphospho)-2-C-methyl-D-erythritol kinase n=1 Tax=Aedoeadaptatus ivorii TaxID=54006 RepID=UPI00277FF537|nr:4-(cytidine 5'-diphospho)-2-C-methyl-D-erythritol kinase [Peptoniphilus ivorii]MDQ0508147.1 4-diphosphocytidyl-2-C-methyl-D-erythritol kinase [Peptoniphilus ivorii]